MGHVGRREAGVPGNTYQQRAIDSLEAGWTAEVFLFLLNLEGKAHKKDTGKEGASWTAAPLRRRHASNGAFMDEERARAQEGSQRCREEDHGTTRGSILTATAPGCCSLAGPPDAAAAAPPLAA